MNLRIKIKPDYSNILTPKEEMDEFEKLIKQVMESGWVHLPISYSDGSILLRKATEREMEMMKK